MIQHVCRLVPRDSARTRADIARGTCRGAKGEDGYARISGLATPADGYRRSTGNISLGQLFSPFLDTRAHNTGLRMFKRNQACATSFRWRAPRRLVQFVPEMM